MDDKISQKLHKVGQIVEQLKNDTRNNELDLKGVPVRIRKILWVEEPETMTRLRRIYATRTDDDATFMKENFLNIERKKTKSL